MRLTHRRVKTLKSFKRTVNKETEGGTYETWGSPQSFKGISWPAGGAVQQAQYGARLPYVFNIKIDGKYTRTEAQNRIKYVLENGTEIYEQDGISLDGSQNPQYQITAIMPYEHLQLEVIRLDRRA